MKTVIPVSPTSRFAKFTGILVPTLASVVIFFAAVCQSVWAADEETKTVSGMVLDDKLVTPLTNAQVRIASPAIDMRGILDDRKGIYTCRTDATGHFSIKVPVSPTISVDVLARGYQEAAGMWMRGNVDLHHIHFPSEQSPFVIKLNPGTYVAGTVVDESGKPIVRAKFESYIRDEHTTSYVAFGNTDEKGHFEIYAFPASPASALGHVKARGEIVFQSPKLLKAAIPDIYSLTEEQRADLKIVMSAGREIKGILTQAEGKPLAGGLVLMMPADVKAAFKSSTTDAEGHFSASGLPDGDVTVRSHSFLLNQKVKKVVKLAGSNLVTNLQMEPIVFKTPPATIECLGMKLADETPELRDIYDVFSTNGAVVLDAGTNAARLGIATLSTGDVFWAVGNKSLLGARDFVTELLRVNEITPPGDPNEGCQGNVRVVYENPQLQKVQTERLHLTDADVKELKKALEKP